MERDAGLPTLLRHRGLGLAAVAALLLVATSSGASVTAPRPLSYPLQARVAACSAVANAVAGTSGADELIMVIAPSLLSRTATVELFRRQGACFRSIAGPYGGYVGVNGLSAHHREGDGTTPLGLFEVQTTMYGAAANPGVSYRYHRLVCGDWWDEDPRSRTYNRFVHVPCGAAAPFAGNSEALWRKVPQYDFFAVVTYNMAPVVAGRGSAIFLHVSKGRPTTGCISIAEVNLIEILRDLKAPLHPLIDITTRQLLAS